VLLDGEGGDELFGCARYLVADRLRRGRTFAAANVARRLPGMGERPRPRWVKRGLVVYGVRGALPLGVHGRLRALRAGRRLPAWLSADGVTLQQQADDGWGWKRTRGPRWWAQLATQLTGEALGAAEQFRRESLLAGVELRHPLRDGELIDLMLRVPPELSFDPDLDRPLLRRAFAEELPPEVVGYTEKVAFNTLLEMAFRGPDRGALTRLLSNLRPELAPLVRPEAVAALFARTSDARPPLSWALDVWRLASLELWLRDLAGEDARETLDSSDARVSFSAAGD
jgi:asparagine synthetase B (glutamine-hydrolysing)